MTTTTLLAAAEPGQVGAASGVFALSWLLIALPLAGAAVLLLGGRRLDPIGPLLGSGTVVAAFLVAFLQFIAMLGRDAEDRAVGQDVYTWFSVQDLHVEVGLLLDPLSMCFALLITFVGALIHIYSIGYMAHDPDRRRFFGYLNLFVAAMLLLVLADNYLVLYVGW